MKALYLVGAPVAVLIATSALRLDPRVTAAAGRRPGAQDKAVPTTRRPPQRSIHLVCSGNMHGILEPCTCQQHQGGGLPRRATMLEAMRARGQTFGLVDTGNLVATQSPNGFVLNEARAILRQM